MNFFRRNMTWYMLISKRFLKKITYCILLLCIPLLTLLLRTTAEKDPGIYHVVLCVPASESAEALAEELVQTGNVVDYTRVCSVEEGRALLDHGQCDAVWVLPEDPETVMADYLAGQADSVFTVYVKEDNIVSQLAREQFFGTIYPELSRLLLKQFVSDRLPSGEGIDTDSIYTKMLPADSLFRYEYPDASSAGSESVLTAPLRGMLAVMLLLLLLAVCICYETDTAEGILVPGKPSSRLIYRLIYLKAGLMPGICIAGISLYFSGTFTGLFKELLLLILYLTGLIGFGLLLTELLPRASMLAAAVPVLLTASLICCPVFVQFDALRPVSLLLPVYYDLCALHSSRMLLMMLLYDVVLYICAFLVHSISRRAAFMSVPPA